MEHRFFNDVYTRFKPATGKKAGNDLLKAAEG
jgi:hypothetical protein